MVIGRVACKGEDDSVTKTSAVDIFSAGPYEKEESSPKGLRAVEHITGVWCCLLPCGTVRWDFPSTCQLSLLNFITCTCKLEVTRLYCQHWKSVSQQEQSCFHSTSLGAVSSIISVLMLLHISTQCCQWMCHSLSDRRLVCFLRIYALRRSRGTIPFVFLYVFSCFHNRPFHLVPLLSQ